MADTAIEWATKVWNPTTGCDRVSPGCDNCYALTMAKRLKAMGSVKYQRDGDPRTSGPGFGISHHSSEVSLPTTWKKSERIFVNSMSDLFHARIPTVFIQRVWETMWLNPQHTFMILTKRPDRMRRILSSPSFWRDIEVWNGDDMLRWPLPNVWLGTSAECQKYAEQRIDDLKATPAAVHFISAEPLLGGIDLSRHLRPHTAQCLTGEPPWCTCGRDADGYIDWVIVGGESGPGARPMHPHWAQTLHRQCDAAGVPFTFKQWGAWSPLAPMKNGKFDFTGGIAMTDDGNTYGRGDLTWPDGPRVGEAIRADFAHHRPTSMYRVGKKRAGRELYHDGRTFDQYPEAVNA